MDNRIIKKRELLSRSNRLKEADIEDISITDLSSTLVELSVPASKLEIQDNKTALAQTNKIIKKMMTQLVMYRQRIKAVKVEIEGKPKNPNYKSVAGFTKKK